MKRGNDAAVSIDTQVEADDATVVELPDLESFYRAHFGFVWRSLIRLGIGAETARDLAQDVFLVVRRRLMDFDPRRSPRAWVYGICRRVASEHRRSSERARKRLRLLPRDAPAPSPEDQVATREAVSLVHEFLAGLDACTQQLFTLSELEGLSGTEIAEALGINRNTVYTRLRRTRARFERMVEQRVGGKE